MSFVQECKVRDAEKGKAQTLFNLKGYNLIVGPCSKDTKKPSAGMGCASREGKVEIFVPKHLTEEFEEATQTGRVERYMMDTGWEQMMQVFNLYGKAGGRKEDIAVTEALLEVIEGEMNAEQERSKQCIPTIICGDFNADKLKLQGITKLNEEEGWIDVGLHADWWGGTPGVPTCEARPGLQETRIDGILANPQAASLIQKAWVEKNPFIPTHAAVSIVVSRNAIEKKVVS